MRRRAARARLALTAVAGLALTACTTVPPAPPTLADLPEFDDGANAAADALPDAAAFLAVDEPMRQFVRAYLTPIVDPLARLERLSNYVLESAATGIRYEPDLTLSAAETFGRRAGNCLSATALIVTLAREAGLQAAFQDVPLLPNWQLSGSAFLVERHVNALVRIGSRSYIVDLRPPESAGFARVRAIADANAIAQYFGNLGVDRFTAGDLDGAYRMFRRGLEADPSATALWVNVGVTLGRNGQDRDAELAYRNALVLDPEDASALNNLALLLQNRGEQREAKKLLARVARYRRSNPYFLYWRGDQHLRAGEYAAALQDFVAAARLEPREADFHFAMARAYLALGRNLAAQRSYAATLELAATASIRARYVDEYRAITRLN